MNSVVIDPNFYMIELIRRVQYGTDDVIFHWMRLGASVWLQHDMLGLYMLNVIPIDKLPTMLRQLLEYPDLAYNIKLLALLSGTLITAAFYDDAYHVAKHLIDHVSNTPETHYVAALAAMHSGRMSMWYYHMEMTDPMSHMVLKDRHGMRVTGPMGYTLSQMGL